MTVNRWTLGRRAVQVLTVLLLASPAIGFTFFQGNLQSASLLGLQLSDPLAGLQVLLLTGTLSLTLLSGMLAVAGGYYLLGGRVFCGWICPVHLLTDLLDLLPGRERLPRWRLSGKWWALLVTALLSLILGLPAFETLSPIGILSRAFSFGAGSALSVVVAIALLELLLVRRAWCRSLCPLGGLYAALGRYSPLRVVYHAERCIHCQRCRQTCFVPEVLAPSLEEGAPCVVSGECTRCFACLGVCPTDALDFGYHNPFKHGGIR